ncbi:MAG: hypothetical protein HC919_15595 [Oscillatoriales cyanobacterium SM2_2_1]|nr:hypothetical protein [Oscillatoriales cyanobacterium SM2_2_1]
MSQQLLSTAWEKLNGHARHLCTRLKSHPESSDYLTWRQQFFQRRLRLGLWLGLFWSLIGAVGGLYSVLVEIEELRANVLTIYGDAAIADALRDLIIFYSLAVLVVLGACLVGQKTRWGQRCPVVWFLLFACSLNEFLGQVIATFFQIPLSPETLTFLAIAIIIPVHWRLHLIAQALPIAYYGIVYPAIGLTTLGTTNIYQLYSSGKLVEIAWVCCVSVPCCLSIRTVEAIGNGSSSSSASVSAFGFP